MRLQPLSINASDTPDTVLFTGIRHIKITMIDNLSLIKNVSLFYLIDQSAG